MTTKTLFTPGKPIPSQAEAISEAGGTDTCVNTCKHHQWLDTLKGLKHQKDREKKSTFSYFERLKRSVLVPCSLREILLLRRYASV